MIDKTPLKIGIIAAIGITLAIAFGFTLDGLYRTGTAGYFVGVVIASMLFLAWFIPQAIALAAPRLMMPILAAETGFMAMAAYRNISLTLAAVLLLAFLLLFYGYRRARHELDNALKIKMLKIGRRATMLAATALALIFTLVYVSAISNERQILTRAQFEPLIKPAAVVLRLMIPGFSWDKTVDKLIGSLLESNLAGGLLPEPIKNLPAVEREAVLAKAVGELRDNIATTLGVPIKARDTAGDILFNFFVGRFQKLPEISRDLVIIALALTLFFLARSVMVLIGWLAQGLSAAIYQLLIAVKFFRIESETREKETIKI